MGFTILPIFEFWKNKKWSFMETHNYEHCKNSFTIQLYPNLASYLTKVLVG
jgi:hypothetical protein